MLNEIIFSRLLTCRFLFSFCLPVLHFCRLVAHQDKLLRQWMYISVGKFCANFFFMSINSNYCFYLTTNGNHDWIFLQKLSFTVKICYLINFLEDRFFKNGPWNVWSDLINLISPTFGDFENKKALCPQLYQDRFYSKFAQPVTSPIQLFI